jgi:PBSX family phage terminase large subunit
MTSQLNYSGLPGYLLQAKLEIARKKAEMFAARKSSQRQWELRGNNLAAQENHDPELILVGAAGTGKTLANLAYINRMMWEYPRLRVLVVRKVRADLAESVLVTFERDILGYDNPICAGIQREHRQAYRYPNGSIMALGGMDRPGKVLSSEWDIIYVPEASQLELNDWETLSMRLARTSNFPFPQLRGDTNPDRPDHWIIQRSRAGTLTLLDTYHRDNPAFWDETANDWTPLGRIYVLGRLARLTGIRKARYYENKWVNAEGAIYEDFSDPVHCIDPFEIPATWTRFRSIDFGYNHAFVCQWWAVDPDGTMYLYREIFKTKRLVEDHARDINRLSAGENIAFTVCDHDAEDRATLKRYGIKTDAAKKAVTAGIQAVQSRMKVDENTKKPRIYFVRGATVERDPDLVDNKKPASTIEEIPGYVWSDKSKKEEPVKEDDHGVDAMRYAVAAIDMGGVKKLTAKARPV